MVSLSPSLTTVSPLACDSPRPPSLSPQQRPSHSSILTASEVRMPDIKAKRAARPKPPPLVLSTEPLHRENKSHNGNDARALAVQVANTSAPASTTKSASVGGPPPSSPAPRHTKAAPPQRNATDPKRKKAKAAGRQRCCEEGRPQVNVEVASTIRTQVRSHCSSRGWHMCLCRSHDDTTPRAHAARCSALPVGSTATSIRVGLA